MKLTRSQTKALHELVAALEGSQEDPDHLVKSEDKYDALRSLSSQELREVITVNGSIDTCDDCDYWWNVSELDEGTCTNCSDE